MGVSSCNLDVMVFRHPGGDIIWDDQDLDLGRQFSDAIPSKG